MERYVIYFFVSILALHIKSGVTERKAEDPVYIDHTMPMIFPTMFLSLLAHLLLRLFVGGILLYLGFRHLRSERAALRAVFSEHWPRLATFSVWYMGVLEIVLGLMFIAGAFTQIAALVTIVFALKMLLFKKRFAHPSIPQPLFWLLMLGASVSLFITGAGAIAYDLPL